MENIKLERHETGGKAKREINGLEEPVWDERAE